MDHLPLFRQAKIFARLGRGFEHVHAGRLGGRVWGGFGTSSPRWAFYAPSLSVTQLASYAASKGYDVLSTINGGEGFWVNAHNGFSAPVPGGRAITTGYFNLASGWSLISTGDYMTPRAFNNQSAAFNDFGPRAGSVAAAWFSTLWAWNSAESTWYFYAPSLDNSAGLAAYTISKGYLDFGNSKLVPRTGFWVNKP